MRYSCKKKHNSRSKILEINTKISTAIGCLISAKNTRQSNLSNGNPRHGQTCTYLNIFLAARLRNLVGQNVSSNTAVTQNNEQELYQVDRDNLPVDARLKRLKITRFLPCFARAEEFKTDFNIFHELRLYAKIKFPLCFR